MNNENEWFETISKLNNDFSKILYIIYYLYNINEINKGQKMLLKNLVLMNEKSIFNLLEILKENKNIKEFSKSIKKIITELNINKTKIEESFNKNTYSAKHIISISNDEDGV